VRHDAIEEGAMSNVTKMPTLDEKGFGVKTSARGCASGGVVDVEAARTLA
jgi:hypothetical protein